MGYPGYWGAMPGRIRAPTHTEIKPDPAKNGENERLEVDGSAVDAPPEAISCSLSWVVGRVTTTPSEGGWKWRTLEVASERLRLYDPWPVTGWRGGGWGWAVPLRFLR